MPDPSTSKLRFTPRLARSVGFLPVFFPPEGCFGHAPIHTQPRPINALQAIVFQQAGFPQFPENPGRDPLLKAIMSCGAGTDIGGIQRFPLTAGTQNKKDGVHACAVVGAGPTSAKAMGIHMPGQDHVDFFPKLVGNAPFLGGDGNVHACASVVRQLARTSLQLHAFL
jgi:hypothetical protein